MGEDDIAYLRELRGDMKIQQRQKQVGQMQLDVIGGKSLEEGQDGYPTGRLWAGFPRQTFADAYWNARYMAIRSGYISHASIAGRRKTGSTRTSFLGVL